MEGRAETLNVRVDPALVDRMLDLYCDWRSACEAVRSAYGRFANASKDGRALGFAAFTAAVDREASAANAYEGQIRLISCGLLASSPANRADPREPVTYPTAPAGEPAETGRLASARQPPP